MNKKQTAIERLKTFEPERGYWLAFSGGKDSIVCKELCRQARVSFTSHYNNTTIDPPELIKYMRTHHPDVIFHKPKEPFLKRLVYKGFPMRHARWCC